MWVKACRSRGSNSKGRVLVLKHKDPSSIPRAHVKVLTIVVHICTPNAGEIETDRPLGLTGWSV